MTILYKNMLNLCMRRHFGISPGFPYASRDVGVSLSVQADDETLAAEAARNWTDGTMLRRIHQSMNP